MISVHHNLEAARRLDSLTVHGLPDCITSVVPAWTTACAHILKPMKVASIGSFVVLSRCSLKSAHIFMNASFSAELID